ncbi:MAG: phosphoribosylformimino-5-aminoimidazole carboxamide ribotide isomerase [Pseudomonadota bacterium]
MTLFKPCIDLHQGKVKQIVGSTLSAEDNSAVVNFESDKSSASFAELFKKDALTGGHIIQLGAGNTEAALMALKAYPGGMQLGGGINPENALEFLQAGASHVIVTSWLFPELSINQKRLQEISNMVGKQNLVIDLSCRKQNGAWYVAKDKWQTVTQEKITPGFIQFIEGYCDELLIHAADVEGKVAGIDEELVSYLGATVKIPTTYAGGARDLADLERVKQLSGDKVDLTIGSALDIFGGRGVKYQDCIDFNKRQSGTD